MRLRLLVALAMVVSVLVATGAAAQGATSERRTGQINWQPCVGAEAFDCAHVRVPLDHDNPRGTQVRLALARLAASDQDNKIGSIFLNPGGPGGSGVNFVLGAGPFLFSDEVRSRFDLVGFDPRGTNRSTPLLCFESQEASFEVFPPFAFPMTPEEEAIEKAGTELLAESCSDPRIRIDEHMSTGDVARDLDLLRQMVGDDHLNYAGYSYGSMLGNTYANLFPDRVRALVIDGVLDPVQWTTGTDNAAATSPFSTRLGSDIGAQDTLDEFFRLCDEAGPGGCAFAPDSAGRFASLADLLLAGPVVIVDPVTGEAFPFTYADLVGSSLGPLYNSASWPEHAAFLAFLEAGATPLELGTALRASLEAAGISTLQSYRPYENFAEGFPGVACSDSDNPNNYEAWPLAAAAAEAANGYFGRLWTHASVPCWNWPSVSDHRYAGPFTAHTANTVLVVSTSYDPATPLHGAVSVNAMLPNSALLTVEGWGHTSLFLSACADAAISDYFLTGLAPADGTVCVQDFGPFDTSAAAEPEVERRQERRRDAMREVALRPGR